MTGNEEEREILQNVKISLSFYVFSLSLQILYGQHGKELFEIYLHLGIDYIGGLVTDVLPARFYGR